MTPRQISLVRDSWAQVVPVSGSIAELFYGRLFELKPGYRTLFQGDMNNQGRMLMSMLNTAIAALDRLDTVAPAIRELGRRHAGYGVAAADYDSVGAAFLWTLEQRLGARFTAEVRDAWVETYATLAGLMIAGAADTGA